MKRYTVLLLLNFLVVIGIVIYLFLQRSTNQTAFIYNQKVFEGYKGTRDLEAKLDLQTKSDRIMLDSLSVLIQKGRNDLQTIYEMKLEAFTANHQQLSERYTADLWKRINEEIANFGNENNYDYIFGASGTGNLMFAKKSNDITDQVIDYLNRKYEGD